ncbi:hypothetical protein PI124_g23109 [Phytophthora idaei]|nr:hypothetical protein PI125_g24729 [Phytophthora idaei]KAG3124883.1 hypothetical protein PI126_g23038 [Phytophthora idaei]KAG3231796.1 hypothetical protein PI124_g23109 [Phytophthora idaei]
MNVGGRLSTPVPIALGLALLLGALENMGECADWPLNAVPCDTTSLFQCMPTPACPVASSPWLLRVATRPDLLLECS